MSPGPEIESASMLFLISLLLCHNDTIYKEWLKSIIISSDSMRKHNYGQNLKLQSPVVTLNIRSRSPKSD